MTLDVNATTDHDQVMVAAKISAAARLKQQLPEKGGAPATSAGGDAVSDLGIGGDGVGAWRCHSFLWGKVLPFFSLATGLGTRGDGDGNGVGSVSLAWCCAGERDEAWGLRMRISNLANHLAETGSVGDRDSGAPKCFAAEL